MQIPRRNTPSTADRGREDASPSTGVELMCDSLRELADAAERAATKIRAEAGDETATSRTSAPDHSPARLTTELGEALARRAEELSREAAALLVQLERTSGLLAAGSHGATVPQASADKPRFDPVRLLATQMAIAGNSREEIDIRLRKDFDATDVAIVLDDVLSLTGAAEEMRRT